MKAQAEILIVEDDPTMRALLQRYLAKAGYAVKEAPDGKTAFRLLAEGLRPRLICVDLMLPDVSGLSILDHVRRTPELSQVPMVVVSARASPLDRANAEEAGANAYIKKPFKAPELLEQVHALLGEEPRGVGGEA